MALTNQQKQEILEVIKANAYVGPYSYFGQSLEISFVPGSDLLWTRSDHILKFHASCTVPYITDLSNMDVYIKENVSVEFLDTVSMRILCIESGASISAPELTTIKDGRLYLTDIANVYLPKLTYIDSLRVSSCVIDNLNIQDCTYLDVDKGSQLVMKSLRDISYLLSVSNNSTVIFLDMIYQLPKINLFKNSTIVAPESSSEVFRDAEYLNETSEIILIPDK